MKKIFEKIRNFWKKEKDDIKKNYVISACSHDFDSKTLETLRKLQRTETIYVFYGIKSGEKSVSYMTGFWTREDADKYHRNMSRHFYSMGYSHLGIKMCNVIGYMEGIDDIGAEGEPGVEGKI